MNTASNTTHSCSNSPFHGGGARNGDEMHGSSTPPPSEGGSDSDEDSEPPEIDYDIARVRVAVMYMYNKCRRMVQVAEDALLLMEGM